tara:strand:- start:6339 stop:6647 length:309 start_codon:yes stop_codon:yes gene_type:complete
MQKTKSKYGRIETMPNGKIYGVVNVTTLDEEQEYKVLSDYIDLGYVILSNEYKFCGGTTGYIIYHYYDTASNTTTSEELDTIEHGVFVMKTELKKYVPNSGK